MKSVAMPQTALRRNAAGISPKEFYSSEHTPRLYCLNGVTEAERRV